MSRKLYKCITKYLSVLFLGAFILVSISGAAFAQDIYQLDGINSDFDDTYSNEVTIDSIRFENDSENWTIYYEANGEPNELNIQKDIIKGIFIVFGIYIFFSLLAVILVLALVIPKQLEYASIKSRDAFWKTNAYGLIAAFAIPWVIFLLGISLIGLPLAGLVAVLGLAAAILSGPFSGYALGHMLVPNKHSLLKALIGGVILLILYFVPLVNIFVLFVAYIYGMGMLINLCIGYKLSDK